MSKMQELYNKVSEDKDLQSQFFSITQNAEQDGAETVKRKLQEFARRAGFEINLEEMESFFKELSEKTAGELSDAELDMVAGGKSTEATSILVASAVTGVFTFGIAMGICAAVAAGK